jgi:predicted nucleotidyltransferase
MATQIENADPILQEMVARLVAAYHPLRVYLFGSRARGESAPDADYDLLVVVARSDQPPYKRAMEAFRLLRGVGASKDVMVWTAEEFDRKVKVVASLPATVLREGQLLYAA